MVSLPASSAVDHEFKPHYNSQATLEQLVTSTYMYQDHTSGVMVSVLASSSIPVKPKTFRL
jgi:hypothetical protein